MGISSDYGDLFRILNRHRVKYLVVGAYAVVYYTEPRFTKDLNIWVDTDAKNADKVYKALKEFGAPLKNIFPEEFADKNVIYQIGVAPIRVDIIMDLPGIKFDLAWKNRSRTKYGAIPINVIGMKELIKSKKKARRTQDRLDLEKLLARIKR